MTLPEGRKPIKWADLTPKHSTWEAEAKALREQNTELALQVLASEGQAEEAYKEQQQAEARVLELEMENGIIRTDKHADAECIGHLERRVAELEAFAKECASYTCTCRGAYVGRKMVDPDCMAAEIGYLAQEVLGQPVTCRGVLATRERWALQKQEVAR